MTGFMLFPKCLHHHQEKPEVLELHGQWNKQTHDPWDHCNETIETIANKVFLTTPT